MSIFNKYELILMYMMLCNNNNKIMKNNGYFSSMSGLCLSSGLELYDCC